MIRVLVPLTLLGNGIGAGVMLSTVLGVVPLTLVLPYERYIRTIQFLWPRYDPFMPAVNALTFVLDIVVAVLAPDATGRILFTSAAVLLAAVMFISVIKNVPINKYVTSLDPDRPPDDWTARDPRVRWRNWNLARTSLALLALAMNVAGTGALL
ncbi:DUF1772 domain-containing protein [Actinoallomurus iriomotensis]|uniref:DUF1772 domain-containing protein n=1 Tax=Actinoallomurus iriomotensis TaxID=478107 RepID=A0A9W6VPA3_9ACTN|nr:DUF1772 domain-containing protein [Actinoallomurus iriomotensis]GLY75515.1 hypothetical protein Airi01_037820 [Actinoallomurus iriomotensis]